MKIKKPERNNKAAKEEFDKETQTYFDGIKTKPRLCVPVFSFGQKGKDDEEEDSMSVSTTSATVVWIVDQYKLYTWVDVYLTQELQELCNENEANTQNIQQEINYIPSEEFYHHCQQNILSSSSGALVLPHVVEGCHTSVSSAMGHLRRRNLPTVSIPEKCLRISGLSSVLRFIFKLAYMKLTSTIDQGLVVEGYACKLQQLLGFRGACLQACAGVSTWTKFCEIDIFDDLDKAVMEIAQVAPNTAAAVIQLPEALFRFEFHLETPVKMHNIHRAERDMRKLALSVKLDGSPTTTSRPEIPPVLNHEFAQGTSMLISDLILYPCVSVYISLLGRTAFEQYFPQVLLWYSRMETEFQLQLSTKLKTSFFPSSSRTALNWSTPSVARDSLHNNDKMKYKPESTVFTRQEDVQESIDSVQSAKIPILAVSDVSTFINWKEIPELAQPEGGRLPASRRERKCQQLSSMAVEVMRVIEEKDKQHNNTSRSSPLRVVDFCSGGGHVGILLAWLLQKKRKCEIILVENKEDSLRRGWERVEQLGLTNVVLYQCNLDYFDGHFDIGLCLHGCGSSTDLVLRKCIAANASFVCCPCCYGAIRSNHMLHYPRSCVFREAGISLKHYFILAHASDQTHDEKNEKTKQGRLCMQLIDSDRCLNAIEKGYQVCLRKMIPSTASPKNHILVGISPVCI